MAAVRQPDQEGEPEARIHFHRDHLGSTRMITTESKRKVAIHDYTPFGRHLTDSLQEGELFRMRTANPEPSKFTGHERDYLRISSVADAEEYVDYMHARYYSPDMGRFLSVDPGKDWDPAQPQSWNMYTYVRNNPINAIDPTGRYQCSGANAGEDCKQIDTAVNDINAARNNLPEDSAERAALDAVVDLLGTKNDGNNTNIVLTNDPSVTGHARTEDGVTTFTMNLSNLVGSNSATARNIAILGYGTSRAELAGALGHEANHGVLQRVHGMAATAPQAFAFELQAYKTQGIVHQGLGVNSVGGYWLPGTGLNQRNILTGALDSVAKWCAQPGARGCR